MFLSPGSFVRVRGRQWVVEQPGLEDGKLKTVRLSCISDDAQGEQLEVLWEAEVDAAVLDDNAWNGIGRGGTDDAAVFAAFLRTLKWNTATAADRNLFQAPFRAGIRLDSYQLLPLRKALRLPRVNLLIADDVGLGKTIEAGLIVRELLLRRRVDFIVVAAPPSMTLQWQDELEAKFGLSFRIIDRDRLAEMRRMRGFGVNPWATGPRFIISHRLLTEETYVAGLRDLLGDFRSRTLFILDEAHHAAPASGTRYAVASQFTKAIEDIAKRFEHRLFLSATPHNGHSNSFSALLEILDPQRFTRGVEVRPTDLEPVMVRRLKADLRRIGESFPERIVKPITLSGLPEDALELRLAKMLSDYGELREKRLKRLPSSEAAHARMIFVGLQQRLLSSVAAFAKTLKVHNKTLQNLIEREAVTNSVATAAKTFTEVADAPDLFEEATEEEALATIESDDVAATEAASRLGAASTSSDELKAELDSVEDMLRAANSAAWEPDARIKWLVDWMRVNMLPGGIWNDRRLILFTEYEDTRRWLERQLKSAFSDTDRIEERIGIFTGATGVPRREEIKLAFNADPASEPIRVLICTDAAREGINLQTRCYDLIHVDLPWNPSRLEQRNGRIDRKLQPADEVFCRYFRYEQREEDIVLDALVRKTEIIRRQLGSAGQVIRERIAGRLAEAGIGRGKARALAQELEAADDPERLGRARAEMDDEEAARHVRLLRELDDLRKALERARERVGVAADDLRQVVEAALSRSRFMLGDAQGEAVGDVQTFRFDPKHEAFSKDSSWSDIFDDLRLRKRKRGERLSEWRSRAPIRAIAFQPPILADGRDAPGVVQLHLEHRLVRRLLSRFISQGFQSGLNRACVIEGPGAQPRVILLGRLALYGPKGARLHEEIIAVTAIWPEADRGAKSLRVLGEVGEATTLSQLEEALKYAKRARESARARVLVHVSDDIQQMLPELERRADGQRERAIRQLRELGEAEAQSLAKLLESQRLRIRKAADKFDPNQLQLPGLPDAERKQMEADRRHWSNRLARLEIELREEPQRVRESYEVRADRLESVGILYLWPATG
jgi:ERCC4-related helicase